MRRIFIINDDESNKHIFEQICVEAGWSKRSTFIPDIITAMNYFREDETLIQSDIEKSLIILNLRPGSSSGTDFILKLKKNQKLKSIPLVVIGESNDVKEVDEIIVMGVNSYFNFPPESDSKHNLIKMILNFWSNEWVR